jgi:glucose dehydrogenase
MRKIVTIMVAGAWAFAFSQVTPQKGDWPVYGHDAAGTRYSPLKQINTANVSQLQRAWIYHTGEKGRSLESTPIFVHGTLYLSTQNQNVVALDPVTGKETS